ncbi:MAG: thioredoxin-dependent thiol peroxidase [Armatimonadota bacterium]|nr:thioredoxin-dependent thiol peroxidase [Armatimonadota bacterium]
MPVEGQKAPEFALKATNGQTISLSEFRGRRNVVLYFYPKDDTPGCTKEACFFRDMQAEFEDVGTVILGVSTDSVKSHEKFAEKYHLPFSLLADEEKRVSTAYGVYKEKSNYGRTYMGVERTTFAIDKEGVIRRVWPKVTLEGHIDEVLDFVKRM